MGIRLGYFRKLSSSVDVGASYSPKTKMSKFDEYTGLFNSSFDIPENYNLGAAIKVTPSIKLSMDYQRINYNKVKTANNDPKISQKMRYSQYVRQPGVNCSKALTPAGQIVESAR
jgi:long-chain fatty acid transport protein